MKNETPEHTKWIAAKAAKVAARERCEALVPSAERYDAYEAKLALVEARIEVENAGHAEALAAMKSWQGDDVDELEADDELALAACPRAFHDRLVALLARREDLPIRSIPAHDAEISEACRTFASACTALIARRRAAGRAAPHRPQQGPAANARVFAEIVRQWLETGPPSPAPSSLLPHLARERDEWRIAIQREREREEEARKRAAKYESVPIGATYAEHRGHGAEDREERKRLLDAFNAR